MKAFNVQNKLLIFYLVFLAVFLLLAGSSSVLAADFNQAQVQKDFFSFLSPLDSFIQKIAEDFGIKPASATAPDPDYCGTTPTLVYDTFFCSGSTPLVHIRWPAIVSPSLPYAPFSYYILTLNGVGSWNTGAATSYDVPVALSPNTTYTWSVEAYFTGGASSFAAGYSGQPHGSFTTGTCCGFAPQDKQYYRSNPSTNTVISNDNISYNQISEHGICHRVINSSSYSYFIPTKSFFEWAKFCESVEAGRLPGISFAACCP